MRNIRLYENLSNPVYFLLQRKFILLLKIPILITIIIITYYPITTNSLDIDYSIFLFFLLSLLLLLLLLLILLILFQIILRLHVGSYFTDKQFSIIFSVLVYLTSVGIHFACGTESNTIQNEWKSFTG